MIIEKSIRFFKGGLLLLQAIAIGAALWDAYKKHKEQNKFHAGRDLVDEQSWESFPASDAPASNHFN